jgi:hypothetical protein
MVERRGTAATWRYGARLARAGNSWSRSRATLSGSRSATSSPASDERGVCSECRHARSASTCGFRCDATEYVRISDEDRGPRAAVPACGSVARGGAAGRSCASGVVRGVGRRRGWSGDAATGCLASVFRCRLLMPVVFHLVCRVFADRWSLRVGVVCVGRRRWAYVARRRWLPR